MSFWDSLANWFRKPPPAPPPPSPTSVPGVSLVHMSWPGTLSFYYSPSFMVDGTGYDQFATVGDQVARFHSNDGRVWTGGAHVFIARPGTWEDDGNSMGTYYTGISDPRVLKNVTAGYAYTMYYTAGRAPNTATSGGIGCAVSNDGNTWFRVGSGMLRSFVGGNGFILQSMIINGKQYLYYLGGGNAAAGIGPSLMVADVSDGIHLSNDRVLSALPNTYVPLFYDEAAGSCWAAVGSATSAPSGPLGFDIYKGGDGFTTLGTKVCTINSSITGNVTNFDPQALQRTYKGTRSNTGSDPVQIMFSTGNTWAAWQPAAVIINT